MKDHSEAAIVSAIITAFLMLLLGVSLELTSRGNELDRKISALTQFELTCMRDNLPYCRDAVIRMEKELDVNYTSQPTA